ncbi:MAG: hypothetical protein JJE19_02400 [Methanosarcinales archaeon]|nr:hypothetical protein [Methanosarcinales archaeon]
MPAFVIERKKAKKIKQKEFKDEKELHYLIDENLREIFGIRYIKDEHITDKHGRIETLGLDESNRPVVIEYKKVKEKGQLSQANRYMTWIKQNPDSFELLARKNLGINIGEIDFPNPRILCFAQDYTIDDKCLALSLGAELWKYRYYENNTLIIIREEEPEQLIKEKGKEKQTIQKISRQPRPPKSIEEHLNGSSKELVKTYEELNNRILDISSEIERYTTNSEIIYKTSLNFAAFAIQKTKNCIRIYLRIIDDKIKDPKNITKKIPKTHGYGNITRVIYVCPKDIKSKKYNYNDIIDLILQSYNTTQ